MPQEVTTAVGPTCPKHRIPLWRLYASLNWEMRVGEYCPMCNAEHLAQVNAIMNKASKEKP